MNHSPRPWSIRKSSNGRTTIVSSDNLEVAFVLRSASYGADNAKLIAAAPDLLHALKEISRKSKAGEMLDIANAIISEVES
jgi:hypothetical protein